MTNDRPTVEVLLGAIDAGVRLVSLPLPAPSTRGNFYVDFVRHVCATEGIDEVVARDDLASRLSSVGLSVRPHSELPRAPLSGRGGQFELVQFSSGSTARPKGILLSDEALGTNVGAILANIESQPGDNVVSWLPLSHDMGLVGMLLGGLVSMCPQMVGTGDIVLIDPLQFLRKPSVWLSAISEWGGRITTSPDFGYRLCAEQGCEASVKLGQLRRAIVGGERVRASTLTDFASRFEANGFRPVAFSPSYGLAEVGLAATMTPVGSQWRQVSAATVPLAEQRLVLEEHSGGQQGTFIPLVSSGPPISGYDVRCEGGPETVGPIWIRGPSVGTDAGTGRSFADRDGWMRTGDLGATIDGWLYVSGRGDDHIVVRARNIYAPAIESAVGSLGGVRSGRVAVLGLPSGDWVIAAESRSANRATPAERRSLVREIRTAAVNVAAASPTEIVLVRRGRLPFTASGKLRRREAVSRYLGGEL